MLLIICIALVMRLGHATGGAQVDVLRHVTAAYCDMGAEFQHIVVCYATD